MKLTKKERFDLNKKIDLSKEINDIADIIVLDIKDGITKHSKDIHDQSFAPISTKWANKKGHSKPLIHKGKMKEVYVSKRATRSNQKAQIKPNDRDRKIPTIVHNEGRNPHKKREWFGISKRVEKKADTYLKLRVEKLLRK